MSSAVLEAKDLWRVFKRRDAKPVEVLRGVDLELRAGELVAVIGPSGAGKSTLLNCLAGIDIPTRGEVTVGGKAISRLSQRELARLRNEHFGLVFQFFHLLNDLSALENVLLASRLYRDRPVPDAGKRAKKLLDVFGLSSRASHHPAELSGGEMQRVAVARALMMDPQILLCDEPTGNLDSVNGQGIIDVLKELAHRDKKTVLIVTHDDRISGIADRVLRMRDGVWNKEN